jgi:predicted small secreted protein
MKNTGWTGAAAVALSLGLLAGCNTMQGMKADAGLGQVTLSGRNEVPPNDSSATGTATVRVGSDRSVSVKMTVSGMTPTAAHIHQGAAGANGPVIVPLDKTGDNTFASKADAKMTEAQYEAYKAGNTYLNVHSAKFPPGEIRAQLKGN